MVTHCGWLMFAFSSPSISCVSWPEGWEIISLSRLSSKYPLCPQFHVRRTFKDTLEELIFVWESRKLSFQIKRDPQTVSLALSVLFKGLGCLAFISGTHLCRNRMKLCVFEQIQQRVSGKMPLPSHVNYEKIPQ